MHTIKIEVSNQAFEKVMYLLKALPKQDVKVISKQNISDEEVADIEAFSSHSANLVEDWQDANEDKIWI